MNIDVLYYFIRQDNNVIGIGSGSTIVYAVQRLGKKFFPSVIHFVLAINFYLNFQNNILG